ncbi:MAG: amidohydrolase/deacetylase family metallohydrolase [Candidatus Latescibacteria bacterium]|jgi:dihydroorotase|nr:amidohydrolase/deacetylase family metallohydrolase [Candidatus Latescibacterota bacterium]
MALDLLLRGGMLVDPHQGIGGIRDIGVRDGRIAVVAEAVSEEATTTLDVGGKVVTPGMIDLHVHVWWGVAHLGIEADPHCVRRGATTVYDAGSAGADTFPGFKKYVIDVSATRIKAFLHIASQGQLNNEIGELTDLRYADVDRAAAMCERYKEDIVGVKIRMTRNLVGDNGREGLKRARAVCEATGLPLMLHPNASPLNLADMLGQMQAGDIMTHCFHSSDTGVLDEVGKVRPEAVAASERGVLFDVGHGAGSFSFQVAETAMRQGLRPGTISSDLHHYNLQGPVYDLATTLSKFMHLGWSLEEAVECATAAPARAMGMLGEIGTLAAGACADVAVFDVEEGAFDFFDAIGEKRIGERRLVPVVTVRAGEIYEPVY